MIRAQLELVTSARVINRQIANIIGEKLSYALNAAIAPIKVQARELIKKAIEESYTYQSMLDETGSLKGEFGFRKSSSVLAPVMEAILSDMEVAIHASTVKIASRQIVGGLYLGVLSKGYRDILAAPTAAYTSRSPRGKFRIEWLNWLLTKGDNYVVIGFESKFNLTPEEIEHSRSKLAIMIESDGNWRVPPEHAGTEYNNFLTKAVAGISDLLLNLIRKEVLRRI